MISSRLVRCYSTPQAALNKLWVKHNGGPPVKVPIAGCKDIDDFAENIKQKLSTNCQVSIFSSLDKEALDPGLTIIELLKYDELKKNSSKIPLFVKLIPITQDSVAPKTIFIRSIDEKDRLLDSYSEVLVKNDADIEKIYERQGSALYLLSEPKKRLTKFEQVKDGEKYDIFGAIYPKTIFIRSIDEKDRPLDSYSEVLVKNDADVREIYKRQGSALYLLSEPKKRLTKFEQVKDGEKYEIFGAVNSFVGWQKNEANAMEAETLLSVKAFLMDKYQASPSNLATEFVGKDRKLIQEWDGILASKDTIFLLESKHQMTFYNVTRIAERVKEFPAMIKLSTQKDFDLKNKKIIGVACGTLFPESCRNLAKFNDLLCVYPSGSRYMVDGKISIDDPSD